MLRHTGDTNIGAGDNYRFVVAKHFTFDGRPPPVELLGGLLRHPAYRDSFLGPRGSGGEQVDVHGPFVIAQLTLEDFASVEPGQVRQTVDGFWANPAYAAPSVGATATLRAVVAELALDAAVAYRLEVDRPAARRKLSWILSEGFDEFVVVTPAAGRLTLLVLGID